MGHIYGLFSMEVKNIEKISLITVLVPIKAADTIQKFFLASKLSHKKRLKIVF